MKTVKRGVHGLFAVLVAVVLLFGANQAFASTDGAVLLYCPGDCPPLTGGMFGTCWQTCEEDDYVGGDCIGGDCCCFE